MKKNMSKKEQVIRIILSGLVAFIAVITNFYWGFILTGILLITGIIGYCPLYNTCPFRKNCKIDNNE